MTARSHSRTRRRLKRLAAKRRAVIARREERTVKSAQ